jgi:hypothetical protein
MLKITGTMMLVLMLTTLSASAAWLAPLESEESSSAETYLAAETTVNGNGMYSPGTYHSRNSTYSAFTPGVMGMMWLSENSDTEPWVAFGFDTPVTIEEMTLWNYNDRSQLSAGILEARVLYTSDTTLPLEDRTWTEAGTITVARATGSEYYSANTVIHVAADLEDLDGEEVTGIMLEVLRTYGSTQAGLSEISFEGEVVPEPATMGLLAVGGIAMLRSRRRRNKK